MEHQDYFQRQIDQLGKVLGATIAKMLNLKEQGQITNAIEMADSEMSEALGFDFEKLLSIPSDEIIATLKKEKNISISGLESLAEIWLFMADYGGNDSEKLYHHTLSILEYLEEVEPNYSLERGWTMERIKRMLE